MSTNWRETSAAGRAKKIRHEPQQIVWIYNLQHALLCLLDKSLTFARFRHNGRREDHHLGPLFSKSLLSRSPWGFRSAAILLTHDARYYIAFIQKEPAADHALQVSERTARASDRINISRAGLAIQIPKVSQILMQFANSVQDRSISGRALARASCGRKQSEKSHPSVPLTCTGPQRRPGRPCAARAARWMRRAGWIRRSRGRR